MKVEVDYRWIPEWTRVDFQLPSSFKNDVMHLIVYISTGELPLSLLAKQNVDMGWDLMEIRGEENEEDMRDRKGRK